MSLGTHWVIDASGCPADYLRDEARVRALLGRLVEGLSLHPLAAPVVHRFPDPGGITAYVLLSESHVALHTFPELGEAALDVFCCRPRAALDWEGVLLESLGTRGVSVRVLSRGAAP